MNNVDYWQKFTQTGSVYDYLAYRHNALNRKKENERTEYNGNGNSSQRDKNKGKR